jgi:glycerophosphoryl diester phosphodiesterase
MFLLVAHRGVVTESLTENSLGALEEAVRRGYTHVEVDVLCTNDGHAVCHHDRNLERTTGRDRNVDAVTLAQLREIATEDLVPSFETFCQHSEDRMGLMIDLKGCPSHLTEQFVASLTRSLEEHGLMDSALFIGKPHLMRRFLGRGRLCWRAPLANARTSELGKQNPGERYFVFNHAADFDADEVDGFHAMGLSVIVSINTGHYRDVDPLQQGLEDVKQMIELGVDGLQIDSVYEEAVPRELFKRPKSADADKTKEE